MHVNPLFVIESIIILFFAIGIHEYAHCKFADMAGDPTPAYYGRVTLNLFKHMDPMGSLFMIITCIAGFGFGWGKPSPMDSKKMRNPRWDLFVAVIAGPISNLCQAFIYAAIFRVLAQSGQSEITDFLAIGILINVELALFNLIPVFPLDGHWLVGLVLPEVPRLKWFQFQRRLNFVGMILLIIYLDTSKNNFLIESVIRVSRIIGGPNF